MSASVLNSVRRAAASVKLLAVNHILRLGDLVPTTAALVAILAASAIPLYAQSQQPDIVKLKADAQNAFNIISSDKLKIQAFCEMAGLANQLDQAERVHDTKKALEASQKWTNWRKNCPNILRWLGA